MGVRIPLSTLNRRKALMGAATFVGACASRDRSQARPHAVLFVCQYGTVKSPIAREHCRRLAAARSVPVRAASRGLSPEDHVTAELLAALEKDGIDIRSEPIRTLAADDLAAADVIVAFDPLPSEFGAWAVRDWSSVPSMIADYPAARADLIPRLEALLNELAGAIPDARS